LINTLLGIVGGLVGIVASILAIREGLRRAAPPRITIPPHDGKNGGRYITIAGVVPRRTKQSLYWVAIQPSDCRGAGVWWPQRHVLTFDRAGRWVLDRATLGREGREGTLDIDKTYTISLVEVPPPQQRLFADAAARGERLVMPVECNLLDSREVERVRY
jgi:hypothetical protein